MVMPKAAVPRGVWRHVGRNTALLSAIEGDDDNGLTGDEVETDSDDRGGAGDSRKGARPWELREM
jgi:hypothetical protein